MVCQPKCLEIYSLFDIDQEQEDLVDDTYSDKPDACSYYVELYIDPCIVYIDYDVLLYSMILP